LKPGGFSTPHLEQAGTPSFDPHWPQNFIAGGFSNWHCGHFMAGSPAGPTSVYTDGDLGEEIYLFRYTLIVYGREVIKKLREAGWEEVRVSGSHHILQKDGRSVPVPVHAGRELGIGLIRKIEKQTGVKLK
jgi:predicted RNA binding protein YcfA (HicA-like mRNA interferase family)